MPILAKLESHIPMPEDEEILDLDSLPYEDLIVIWRELIDGGEFELADQLEEYIEDNFETDPVDLLLDAMNDFNGNPELN